MRPENDRIKAVLMSFFFFLIITSYYVIKPVRNSLVTAVLGTNMMATLNIVLIIVIAICVLIYNYVLGKFSKARVIAGSYVFFISNLIFFWLIHHVFRQTRPDALKGFALQIYVNFDFIMGVLFFLWVGSYNVIIVSIFFTFCNDLFSKENGKRLYALIGAGGVIGGVVGSEVSGFFVEFLGSNNLLLISAGILACCLVIIMIIFSILKSEGRFELLMNRKIEPGKKTSTLDALMVFKSSRYARLIGFMMLLLTMMATLFSFVFSHQTEIEIVPGQKEIIASLTGSVKSEVSYGLEPVREFEDYMYRTENGIDLATAPEKIKYIYSQRSQRLKQEKATEFWADFNKYMGYLSIFIQVVLTRFINTRFGIPFSVFLLPTVFIMGSFWMCFQMSLGIIWWISLFQFGIGYSLFQSSKEQLFLPAGEDVKYRAKSVIDNILVRGADALSSMLFHVLVTFLALSYKSLVIACALLCIPLVKVLINLGSEYYDITSST